MMSLMARLCALCALSAVIQMALGESDAKAKLADDWRTADAVSDAERRARIRSRP